MCLYMFQKNDDVSIYRIQVQISSIKAYLGKAFYSL